MVRCQNCGDIVSTTKNYCPNCGKAIKFGNVKWGTKKNEKRNLFVILFSIILIIISVLAIIIMIGPSEHEIEIVIDYDGGWQGALAISTGTSESISGQGMKSYSYDTDGKITFSVNAQKQDDSLKPLTIKIYQDGELVKDGSTTTAYGIVQLTYTVK